MIQKRVMIVFCKLAIILLLMGLREDFTDRGTKCRFDDKHH